MTCCFCSILNLIEALVVQMIVSLIHILMFYFLIERSNIKRKKYIA
jgi:preprotein translocase subunit YajC